MFKLHIRSRYGISCQDLEGALCLGSCNPLYLKFLRVRDGLARLGRRPGSCSPHPSVVKLPA
jgi:hypothetical protein